MEFEAHISRLFLQGKRRGHRLVAFMTSYKKYIPPVYNHWAIFKYISDPIKHIAHSPNEFLKQFYKIGKMFSLYTRRN